MKNQPDVTVSGGGTVYLHPGVSLLRRAATHLITAGDGPTLWALLLIDRQVNVLLADQSTVFNQLRAQVDAL